MKQKQVNRWYGDNDYCNNYESVKLYNDKKTHGPKNKIKEELMLIPESSMKMRGYHMTEDESKRVQEMFP